MSELYNFNKYFNNIKIYEADKPSEEVSMSGNTNSEEEHIERELELEDIMNLSDGDIVVGDYVVCVDYDNLGAQTKDYLNDKTVFKVENIIKDEIDIGFKFTIKTSRFKKVDVSFNINTGDFVIVNDTARQKLPKDVYEYMLSKKVFQVLSTKKVENNVMIDIGLRNDRNVTFWFSYGRFVAVKPPKDFVFTVYEDDKKHIEDNYNKYWIDPEKFEIARVTEIEENVMKYDLMGMKGQKEMTSTFNRFTEYYSVLSSDYIDIIKYKIMELETEKREEIRELMEKYKKPYTYFNNILNLIKKS